MGLGLAISAWSVALLALFYPGTNALGEPLARTGLCLFPLLFAATIPPPSGKRGVPWQVVGGLACAPLIVALQLDSSSGQAAYATAGGGFVLLLLAHTTVDRMRARRALARTYGVAWLTLGVGVPVLWLLAYFTDNPLTSVLARAACASPLASSFELGAPLLRVGSFVFVGCFFVASLYAVPDAQDRE